LFSDYYFEPSAMLIATYHKHILTFNFPAGTSRGVLTEKPSWIIKLYNQENHNIVGTGECSIINGLSPDPSKGYEAMLDKACSNPAHFLSFSEPELDRFPSIRFGLEMAWQDLRQGGTGLLFKSEYTKGQSGIPINGLIWMDSKENMLQQIRKRVEEGFQCIKMKIGAMDFKEEIDFLRAIRKEFSADIIQLRVDANGAFEPSEALEKLKRLSYFNLHSIEQPIRPGNWPAIAALCEKSPLPIALDEELFAPDSDSDKINLLKSIRPQYLVLKPSMLGGFAKTQEWIDASENLNIGWWITSALESNIGLNALSQWTYTLNNPMHHGLGTGKLFVNNFPSKLFIENGVLKYK
jgi:o-succinylbenzoate synthase